MNKIEKLQEIKLKSDARGPWIIMKIVEKINELVDVANKSTGGKK